VPAVSAPSINGLQLADSGAVPRGERTGNRLAHTVHLRHNPCWGCADDAGGVRARLGVCGRGWGCPGRGREPCAQGERTGNQPAHTVHLRHNLCWGCAGDVGVVRATLGLCGPSWGVVRPRPMTHARRTLRGGRQARAIRTTGSWTGTDDVTVARSAHDLNGVPTIRGSGAASGGAAG
jgi:hypothetical protein